MGIAALQMHRMVLGELQAGDRGQTAPSQLRRG